MSGGYPLNPGPYPAQPGGLSKDKCISAEGLSEVLCFAFRTDNTGPPETVQVKFSLNPNSFLCVVLSFCFLCVNIKASGAFSVATSSMTMEIMGVKRILLAGITALHSCMHVK